MNDMKWLYVVRFTRLVVKMLYRHCVFAGDKFPESEHREYERFLNQDLQLSETTSRIMRKEKDEE